MLDLFPPTDQQRAVIEQRGRNLLVLAGPGTGKTETLARRFASLVFDGVPAHRILVLTFSRRAADEMRDRLLLRLRQLHSRGIAVPELFVKTFHSFCARLLQGDESRAYDRRLLTPVKERLLWRRLVQGGTQTLESFAPSVAQSPQFAADCLNVIAQLKGRGVGAQRVAELAQKDVRLRDLARLYEQMEAQRMQIDLHDFRDLVNEAERALRDAGSAASAWLRSARFAHILVDEFQDSDRMQLELLEAMRVAIRPEPSFCFVGDKNQSIYRFRGAAPDNVESARESFACEVLELHQNRRSAQAVLDVANKDELLDAASKTEADDPKRPGAVCFERLRTIADEVVRIRDAVARRIASGTDPKAIAVLLRQTRPYQELVIEALREAGIPVAAQPTAGFHADGLVDAMLTSLRLLANPDDIGLWRRLLINPIVGYRPVEVRTAFDAGRRSGCADPQEALARARPAGVRSMRGFLASWKRCLEAYARAGPHSLLQTVVNELDLLRPIREKRPVEGFDLRASPARLRALMDAAADYEQLDAREHERSEASAEFVSHLDETIGLLADASLPPPAASDGVRVISIHAAKGLEFDFVVVPQLVDPVFPAAARLNRLLPEHSIEALRRGQVDIFVDEDDARTEEHSLWYVALTRARDEVLVTAPRVDDEGVELQPSVFTQSIEPASPASGEGAALQPSLAPDAALGVTGEPPFAQAAHAAHAARAASAAQPGIIVPIEALSPTSINTFVSCPRQFFYAKVLRLPGRDDDATRYGRMLHDLLAQLHNVEKDFFGSRDARSVAERCRKTLRSLAWGAEAAGQGPLDRYEREDLERKLDEYVERLAELASSEPFRVLACELPVSSSLGGLTIHGKVDRIDRLESGDLVIRDYKSGRRHGDLADAVRKAFRRIDDGAVLFGDAPAGLNLQTLLYIPGVEDHFGARVCAVEYVYFRGKSADDPALLFDRTRIVAESGTDGGQAALGRDEVDRVRRDIAARIERSCSDGSMRSFATTLDERLCTFCDYAQICPGAGAISA